MQIYTSYFAQIKNLKKDNIFPVCISLYPPQFVKEDSTILVWKSVAPTESILKQIKNSAHTERDKEIYTERYLSEVLGKYDNTYLWLLQELYSLVPDGTERVALLCYEKPSDFCHRHILAKWLNEKNPELSITEYKHINSSNNGSSSNPSDSSNISFSNALF